MSVANILSMAGGLGLFLFGIRTMGDGLENAAGAKLKRMLEVLTGNRFLAVLVGFVVTAIIQSSTATTVMVVGFVNAGMMSLAQAVGVIMGANIGTTVTSLLIALNFSSVAAAAVLVGVILMLASKKTVVKNLGAIFTGFGLLFLGIDMMSDSMAPLRESAGFMNFIVTVSESPLRPLFGIILGIVMTAVLQSSSASVGVLQTLAMQGLVPLKFSVFVLFGQNIGTCLTALFSTVGAKKNSKRAAVIHLLFNLIGTGIFILIALLAPYVEWIEKLSPDPMAQIAISHIVFNIVSTVVMFPFAKVLVKLSCLLVPGKDDSESEMHCKFIDDRLLNTPPFAVMQVSKEVARMAKLARDNFETSAHALINRSDKDLDKVMENEDVINYLNHHITSYLVKLNALDITDSDSDYIARVFHAINDIERVGDHAINLAEAAQHNIGEGLKFSDPAREELNQLCGSVVTLLERSMAAFDNQSLSDNEAKELSDLEEHIDDLTIECQDSHIFRLNRKECNTEAGMLYLNTITDFERVGDHAINIAFLARSK
ncbi:MAG: Na/Pi cotransporter family protein [Oscillospiraceae bacterium]|nr:Na/Pi cotransporter family protein [Oscillospiraceae bacterium]MDD6982375.1 Na/Pi cotransporter family protein [Oscillospiraceae bacterium]MDY4623205.1 Na/Pi cotransporter family protein [Oscillospiraceae bacterium]